MKRTLLLSVGFGAALVAGAATPNYLQQVRSNNNLQKVNVQKLSVAQRFATVSPKDFSKVTPVSQLNLKPNLTADAALTQPMYGMLGAFYDGIDEDYHYYYMPFVNCPPFEEVDYVNASGKTTSLWSYGIGDQSTAGGDTYTSTDQHLTINYPMTYSSAPNLKVADGSEWQMFGYGSTGDVLPAVVNSTGIPNSICVQPMNGFWAPSQSGSYLFGSDCKAGADGFAVLYNAPAVPYYVEQARMVFVGLSLKNGAELTLNVYAVDDEGKVSDEKYAVGIATADDIVAFGSFSCATFHFYEEDDLGGMTEIALYPDQSLLYELTDFAGNEDIKFSSVCFNWPFVDDEQTTQIVYPLEVGYFVANDRFIPFSSVYEGLQNSAVLALDGLMGGLDFEKTSNHFADNGGSVEFAVDNNVEIFQAYASNPGEYYVIENDIPDWLTISLSYDAATGTTFQITADPLPAGVTGRRADISFTTVIGGRATFIATQGDASVSSVAAAASKVAVVDGNFVVESDNATAVEVYNLAGQKVAETTFAGQATVPAADLAKGVYVVKFNDNTVVKVAK